jgi:Tetratricopeptide repeat
VHIAGSVPKQDGSGHSPWEGMSGAALFSGPLIVGVIVIDPAHFGTDRVEAVPITATITEPEFCEALTGDADATLVLPAVEAIDATRGVLRPPYRPLPAKATPQALRRGGSHFLLAAEYGIVPFHGRSELLEELGDWCRGEAGLEVALVHSPGGTGKTRLAAELCRRAQIGGAVAGFLEHDATADQLAGLGELTTPLLVVIDEAPGRIDDIANVLVGLARAQGGVPLRVVLLARHAGEWWDSLLPQRLDDPDARWASSTVVPHVLGSVDDTVGARERAFDAAAAAFAARIGRDVSQMPRPDFAQQLFEQILFVHLAALSALEGKPETLTERIVRPDLLNVALVRESSYWADTANAIGLELGPVPLQRAVALATLTVADDEEEAARALTAVPDLADASQEPLRLEVARWLRELYPAPAAQPTHTEGADPWFRPLTPVPLGEALIAQTIQSAPNLPNRVLDAATPTQAKRALTVLTQTASAFASANDSSHAAVEAALLRALVTHLAAHWQVALEVVQEIGDPLGQLVASALGLIDDDELGAAVASALPVRTVALREVAVVATRQAIRRCYEQPESAERLADLHSALARRLYEVGDHNAAQEEGEKSVAVARKLAEQQPAAFRPLLAQMLLNHAATLRSAEKVQEALAAAMDAREISDQLVQDALAADREAGEISCQLGMEDSAHFRIRASASLNLSVVLGIVGLRQESLRELDFAIGTYRILSDVDPEWARPLLAGALLNRAAALQDLGLSPDALVAANEAVDIYRPLADERPDAFAPELAMALSNQSNALGELRRDKEALEAIDESVRILRRLAAGRPAAFNPELSNCLSGLARRLDALGERDRALKTMDEAVRTRRGLADSNPVMHGPGLAALVNDQATLLDDPERALALIDEALAIYDEMPDSRRRPLLPQLGCVLDNRVLRLFELGRPADAQVTGERAVRIHRALSDLDEAFLPELSNSLHNHALCLTATGLHDAAGNEIDEAVRIRRRLAETNPDRFKPLLARSLNNQSEAQAQLQRADEALATMEEAVVIDRELISRHPDRFAADFAESLHHLAVRLNAMGRPTDAMPYVEEGLEIVRQIMARSPGTEPRAAAPLLQDYWYLRSVLDSTS